MRHPTRLAALVAASLTTLAVGAGTAAAQSSATSDGQYSVSDATVSQSMVHGSSPTSPRDNPPAPAPARSWVPSAGQYSVSDATVSQSMVNGSSPTSLGDSPLAQTPAGRAAAAAAAATTTTQPPTGDPEYTVSTADVVYKTAAGKVL